MFYLIGLGYSIEHLSIGAIEAIKRSDYLYLDSYTSFVEDDYLNYIRSLANKEVYPLDRSSLEERASVILDKAATSNIALLVPGDPLIATTHHILLDYLSSKGIRFKVVNNLSFLHLVYSLSNLDIYKFAPPFTLPYWLDNYKPTSFLDKLKLNLEIKMHSVIILDINKELKRSMSLQEAYATISKAQEDRRLNIIDDDTMILLMSDLGTSSQRIVYAKLSDLIRMQYSYRLATLILPVCSIAEEEALEKYKLKG
ncbi:MAG: diphthine synthase [Candidatus Micrarchaeota archaeon]|nr:MAG: diphthine synthase [Candidatus Micrarchaeota archaeon]